MSQGNKCSACYVIDDEFNLVTFNDVAKETYPTLVKGKKCHQCLMGHDEPCDACPIKRGIKGPKTYLDPIRQIYETVDAINIPLRDGRNGYALVLSTTGDREAVSRQLPTSEKELRFLLNQESFDKLTGSLSREGFIHELDGRMAKEGLSEYAVIVFDIYNFKAINEIFGIDGGDHLLRYVIDKISTSPLKPVSSGRLESDWFVFLVHRDHLSLDQLNSLLSMEYNYHGRTIHLRLRCGIYFVEDHQASASQMVEWAIIAKQSVTHKSMRQYALYEPKMSKDNMGEAQMLLDFKKSLVEHQFQAYFQPIISLHTGKITAAEALVRWIHPQKGLIAPNIFINLFEKNGQITRLDQEILSQVYHFQKKRVKDHKKFVPISVNLSWQDFYDDHLMDEVLTLSKSADLPEGLVNFELVESSIAALEQNVAYLLNQIQESGAKLLLDDFGTGYSSFGILGSYPFHIVKIDRSFVCQIENNQKVRSIVASIIEMAHRLDIETVAEGVENEQQLHILMKQGCDNIQGYYFSRPLCEKDFIQFLDADQNWLLPFEEVLQKDHLPVAPLFDLLDHSGMFIQVCHPEDHTMVYANALTRMVSGHPDKPYKGELCYEYMLGLNAPCGHCPMNKMGDEDEKQLEVDDGEHIFSLTGRYTEWNGRRVFIEYGRDVTDTKNAQRRYTNRIKEILESIPDGQGIFHVDLTSDSWLSSGGHAENARAMQNIKNVNELIHMIGSFVPEKEGQEKFFQVFCREALLEAYKENQHQVLLETNSYYDDGKIRWSRIIANLIENPSNGHIECIIYGIDISDEKARLEELRLKEQQELQKEMNEVRELYSQADHDRRIDFLTGLHNRLDLFESMKKTLAGEYPPIQTMYMLDIDNFKAINDTYGHRVGDECLKMIGQLLKDYGEAHDVYFYRYGGEEFLGLGVSFADPWKFGNDLLEKVRQLKVPVAENQTISFTASVGYTCDNRRYEKMIELADQAMYVAKKQGKDCVVGE